MRARTMWLAGATAALLLAACGDDDDDDAGAATTEASSEATDAAEEDTAPPAEGSAPAAEGSTPTGSEPEGTLPVPDEICALAEQIFAQEDFPSEAQLTKYQELAPEELAASVDVAATALLEADGDLVATFNAIGDDDVEAAIAEIDAWEEENCDIPHSAQETPVPAGASQEIEDGANRVDVTATDFAFEVASPVEAGRTSFVMTNEGAEAHFLLVVKLAEGVTLEDAMATEGGPGVVEGEWETAIASAGDEEAITFDVEPGTYGLVCFLPTADGTPHAMLGMAQEITVA